MGVANGERTGTRILTLLAAPLNALILSKLSQGPRRLVELRRETGSPQTTLRAHLKELSEVGAIAKRRLHPFPSVREYVLTNPGSELRFVATTLEAWLAKDPGEPLPLGGDAARAEVKALVEGWSSKMLRALAGGPVTLAEIDETIESLSHQSLERRLAGLRRAGLVTGGSGQDRSTRYEVTERLRQGIAPLVAAIRWERKHLTEVTAPVTPVDAETGLLLAIPPLRLPAEMSGSCRLGVEFDECGERRLVGVTVSVEEGRIVSCTTRLDSSPGSWATGPAAAWLRVAIEADPSRLELGGNQRLARALLDELNRALFPPRLI